MSLNDYQREVDEWASKFDPKYWPALQQFARLAEETGEVARVLNHIYGHKKLKPDEAQRELGGELSDVLFTLICMANSHGINLDEEWKKMMDKLNSRDANRFKPSDLNPKI